MGTAGSGTGAGGVLVTRVRNGLEAGVPPPACPPYRRCRPGTGLRRCGPCAWHPRSRHPGIRCEAEARSRRGGALCALSLPGRDQAAGRSAARGGPRRRSPGRRRARRVRQPRRRTAHGAAGTDRARHGTGRASANRDAVLAVLARRPGPHRHPGRPVPAAPSAAADQDHRHPAPGTRHPAPGTCHPAPRCRGAAVAVGRRGLGYRVRCRPGVTAAGQRNGVSAVSVPGGPRTGAGATPAGRRGLAGGGPSRAKRPAGEPAPGGAAGGCPGPCPGLRLVGLVLSRTAALRVFAGLTGRLPQRGQPRAVVEWVRGRGEGRAVGAAGR
jgi:hypothetical protein